MLSPQSQIAELRAMQDAYAMCRALCMKCFRSVRFSLVLAIFAIVITQALLCLPTRVLDVYMISVNGVIRSAIPCRE